MSATDNAAISSFVLRLDGIRTQAPAGAETALVVAGFALASCMATAYWRIASLRGSIEPVSEPESWLNHVLAVPAIGLVTKQRLAFPSLVWQLLETVAPSWAKDGHGEAHIKAVNATDVRVERGHGLYMNLSPSGVVVGFTFNLAVERPPGGLPKLAAEPAIQGYLRLQAIAFEQLTSFLKSGFGTAASYAVIRIGVVAQTKLVESDAPPGVGAYLNSLQEAATGELTAINSALTHVIARNDSWRDQCIHTCGKDATTRPDDLDLSLDFQRVWNEATPVQGSRIADEIASVQRAANVYFESFGAGIE